MPKWMHERADHIQAKNPDMSKSEAFAIATQQMHALGKSPKGYGTAEGKRTAKAKYDTPGDDMKTPNPVDLSKTAAVMFAAFEDELQKIAAALPKDDIGLANSMGDLAMRQSAASWAVPTGMATAVPGALLGAAIGGSRGGQFGRGALLGGAATGLLGAHAAHMAHARSKAYALGRQAQAE